MCPEDVHVHHPAHAAGVERSRHYRTAIASCCVVCRIIVLLSYHHILMMSFVKPYSVAKLKPAALHAVPHACLIWG